MVLMRCATFILIVNLAAVSQSADWMAGTARVDITPSQHVWMGGYASRTRPADGVLHLLWAKALVIADGADERVAIITLDLLGDNFGRALADRIRNQAARASGIEPSKIVFNFSHTHTGPVTRVNDGATVTYGLGDPQQRLVRAYTSELEKELVSLILAASRSMRPATLVFGQGSTEFAANRRTQHNPHGPVDHGVPVLGVLNDQGQPMAVLFGYACHTATLTGEFYRYSGDYAGFAQIALEKSYPGATALFVMGCGADANPAPRGTVALARQHGASLALAVEQVLNGDTQQLSGPLSVQFDRVELPFVEPPTKADLEGRRGQGNIYEKRLTDVLLKRLAGDGRLASGYAFPVHVVRFGKELSFVGLSGETVVDYAIRLRRDSTDVLWVAGYCNEVFAYVPSERVLAEGGYEAGGAMQYFGIHGPFKPGLEAKIIDLVDRLMHN
jgi:neutral ceramidase